MFHQDEGGKNNKERRRQNLGDGESVMGEEGKKALHWSWGAHWSKSKTLHD